MKNKSIKVLKNRENFPYKKELVEFDECIKKASVMDFKIDEKILYLKQLRECEKIYDKIAYLYLKSVRKSMDDDDFKTFSKLLEVDIYKSDSLKEDMLEYYKKNRDRKKIALGEKMLEDANIEKQSRERYEQEYAQYEEHIAVLKAKEAKRLREMSAPSKRQKVTISTKKSSDGYDFIAENFNTFRVTVTLKFKKRVNIISDKKLPLYFELDAKSSKKVLHVGVKDKRKSMMFQSSFSWIMGSASAVHDDVAYSIPFKKGSKIRVSQGYNGKSSHRHKNAIDFAVNIGTPIYAARGGKVVRVESSHNRGKFKKGYGKYANYIIIEHSDRTLGKYYHLKKDGVCVKLGATVKRGELIAYSGNTGYTSGPHLHFSVSKVDERVMNRSKTIAVKFINAGEIIPTPKKGDFIIVR